MDKSRGAQHGYIYDGAHKDGLLHYTGEGRYGHQEMVQGNRAIRDHEQEGRALHVFDVHKGIAVHLGQFEYVDHYPAEAPPSGGGEDRLVLVFKLKRLTGSTALPPASVDIKDSPSWVKEIPVEQHLMTEDIPINPQPYKAKRREQKLVKELEAWLDASGHQVCSLELHAKGEPKAFRCDLFDKTDNVIIEAKSSVARPAFRMAIGQLADYARLMKKPPRKRMVLVPEQPRADLISLAKSQKIGVIWPDGEGGFVTRS